LSAKLPGFPRFFYKWSAAYTHRSFPFVLRFDIAVFNLIPLSALVAFHVEAWHATPHRQLALRLLHGPRGSGFGGASSISLKISASLN